MSIPEFKHKMQNLKLAKSKFKLKCVPLNFYEFLKNGKMRDFLKRILKR